MMRTTTTINSVVFAVMSGLVSVAQAMDIEGFKKIANDTIRQIDMGVIGDIDALMAQQEQLMVIGVEGGVEYLQQNPAGGRPLQLTILNAQDMKDLSLDEIETQWHQGKFYESKGIDRDKIDHFGPLMSLMDAIVHPATSYIALREYKKTGKVELLQRAKSELVEVLVHVAQLSPDMSASHSQVSSNR